MGLNGERIHEKLIGRDECSNALETDEMVIIRPLQDALDTPIRAEDYSGARKITAHGYSTETAELQSHLLTKPQIAKMLAKTALHIDESFF